MRLQAQERYGVKNEYLVIKFCGLTRSVGIKETFNIIWGRRGRRGRNQRRSIENQQRNGEEELAKNDSKRRGRDIQHATSIS